MNRKDIIVVAVLINAGLLMALFIGALKTDRAPVEAVKVFKDDPTKLSYVVPSKEQENIDHILNQYTSKKEVEKEQSSVLPSPVLTPVHRDKKSVTHSMEKEKSKEGRMVKVKKGDVLEKIARFYDVSVEDIMKLNQLSDEHLQIGQQLQIPDKTNSSCGKEKYYIVKGGDSLWTIAQKNHIKLEELLRLNDMDDVKAKRLRPGDRLRIE